LNTRPEASEIVSAPAPGPTIATDFVIGISEDSAIVAGSESES
jgi:hypothetical protein